MLCIHAHTKKLLEGWCLEIYCISSMSAPGSENMYFFHLSRKKYFRYKYSYCQTYACTYLCSSACAHTCIRAKERRNRKTLVDWIKFLRSLLYSLFSAIDVYVSFFSTLYIYTNPLIVSIWNAIKSECNGICRHHWSHGMHA